MARSVRIRLAVAKELMGFAKYATGYEDGVFIQLRRAIEAVERLYRFPKSEPPPRKGSVSVEKWSRGIRELGHVSRKPSKSDKRSETAAIWEACWKRCGDPIRGYHVCECGCGQAVIRDTDDLNAKAELEHPFSKGKGARLPQSVEACWILRGDCHRERTNNRPDAETWWRKFLDHCGRQAWVAGVMGAYGAPWAAALKRLAFVETRSSLPASPGRKP